MQEQTTSLKKFLQIPYDELEAMNIQAAKDAKSLSEEELKAKYTEYLSKEKAIKAVTICFTDIEGRFQSLDYDKQFFLKSGNNLTFDGSSIKGFSDQSESDLRLTPDWGSIYWLPADIFGPGKVIFFGSVLNRDRSPYQSDFRSRLKILCNELKKENVVPHVAAEVEGFVVKGINAEQTYNKAKGFELISEGGYFHSLPLEPLKIFIDTVAEAQRAMGFENEKDHPEVAPSQFELNYKHCEALRACDLVQLYKLVCRQTAASMGYTATFLPKPVAGVNGSGMHLNLSIFRNGRNVFYDENGKYRLSQDGWEYAGKLLDSARELSLIFNSSVNAYRRLDPRYEAPNKVTISSVNRGAMIRIPSFDENSARLEIRSVAPDANPYLSVFAMLSIMRRNTDNHGKKIQYSDNPRPESIKLLPPTLKDAIRLFRNSRLMKEIMGNHAFEKYISCKQAVANRSAKELGNIIKTAEVQFHHEITTQQLWNRF